jgi:hypothetical protein
MKAAPETRPPARPRASWRPPAKIRPCMICNRPRVSTSPADRMHATCRLTGENDGERAGLVLP